jgi:hypothetical protein
LTTFANLLENFANIFYIMKLKGKIINWMGLVKNEQDPKVSSSLVVVDALVYSKYSEIKTHC